MSKLYYHFTGDNLRDGRPLPAIGEWLKHDGAIVICKSGFHASPTAFQALQHAPGNLLHRVELRGDLIEESDKSVGRERRIVASIDATDLLRRFSRTMALKVIHLWAAPSIVREYLETGDESKRAAARAAARDAAWAARAAAGAARAAAGDAAWAAARDAAWAARDAAWAEYAAIFNAMVDEEFAKQAEHAN
jgi:hypothetical protein